MAATETVVCPSCETRGVIEGIAPEVVPEQIKCGGCQHIFPFHPSRYDILRQDYDGEQNVWPMKVTVRDPRSFVEVSEDPEAVRLGHLASVPTKRLLGAFKAHAYSRDNYNEGAVRDDSSIRISGLWHLSFTGAEVRAELAKREHIPSKQEARAKRQKLARAGRGDPMEPYDPVRGRGRKPKSSRRRRSK